MRSASLWLAIAGLVALLLSTQLAWATVESRCANTQAERGILDASGAAWPPLFVLGMLAATGAAIWGRRAVTGIGALGLGLAALALLWGLGLGDGSSVEMLRPTPQGRQFVHCGFVAATGYWVALGSVGFAAAAIALRARTQAAA